MISHQVIFQIWLGTNSMDWQSLLYNQSSLLQDWLLQWKCGTGATSQERLQWSQPSNIIYLSKSEPLTRNQPCGLNNKDTDSIFTQHFNTAFGHSRIQVPSILYSAINQGWVVTASSLGRDRREHGGGISIVLRVPRPEVTILSLQFHMKERILTWSHLTTREVNAVLMRQLYDSILFPLPWNKEITYSNYLSN